MPGHKLHLLDRVLFRAHQFNPASILSTDGGPDQPSPFCRFQHFYDSEALGEFCLLTDGHPVHHGTDRQMAIDAVGNVQEAPADGSERVGREQLSKVAE